MARTIVQVHFTLSGSRAEYETAMAPVAQMVLETAGLQWKIWLLNEAEQEASGILLFTDEVSAQAYLAGPVLAHMTSLPVIRDLRAKQFTVLAALTAATWGPAEEYAPGL